MYKTFDEDFCTQRIRLKIKIQNIFPLKYVLFKVLMPLIITIWLKLFFFSFLEHVCEEQLFYIVSPKDIIIAKVKIMKCPLSFIYLNGNIVFQFHILLTNTNSMWSWTANVICYDFVINFVFFFFQPRDSDDNITFLLEREEFEKALKLAETKQNDLKKYTVLVKISF